MSDFLPHSWSGKKMYLSQSCTQTSSAINIHFLAALTLYATTVDLNPNKQINLCLKGRFFSFNSEVLQK